ncbi:hypothetical protein EDD17DRAFT_1644419 [Pisolithus thermaeus]|nr:hypothetical protein EDD17DRAFT_1644419 [Pisolithus thermaeus]
MTECDAHSDAHHAAVGTIVQREQIFLSQGRPLNTLHTDDTPTVQTKAKMNLALSRSGAPHFGTDSMFEGEQPFADMDAPLTASIRDVFGDTTLSMSAPPRMSRPSWRFSLDNSTFPSTSRTPRSETTPSSTPVYVVVFGYPPYKYSVTVVTSSHSKPPQIQKLTPKSSITSELGTRMRQRQCEQ